jgi:hypothetical protein
MDTPQECRQTIKCPKRELAELHCRRTYDQRLDAAERHLAHDASRLAVSVFADLSTGRTG